MRCNISGLCKIHGISRQAYYKHCQASMKKEINESMILQLVKNVRLRQPMIGVRKLHYLLDSDFEKMGIEIGRDKLFKIMRRNNLLTKRKKRYVRTTDSHHRFRIYKNLISDLHPEGVNQVLVSDITYLRLRNSFNYLSLVIDLYSRKIIGYKLSNNLSVKGNMISLKQALRYIKDPKGMIHHSDRGFQYCSTQYTDYLESKGILISMSGKGNAYDNAVAERVIGILKQEFFLGDTYNDHRTLKKAVDEAIQIYNNERPHMSLNMSTPASKYAA